MLTPVTQLLAATLTAVMIFLWVIVLHIRRAVANIHDSNETTADFEAVAMTGAAVLVACSQRNPERRDAIVCGQTHVAGQSAD